MRSILLLAAISLIACRRRPAPDAAEAVPSEQITSASTAPSMAATSAPEPLRGSVREKIDVNQYTYLRIASPAGEVWAAVPKSGVAGGETVTVSGAMWMENFKSETLSRTWPRIAFGVLQNDAAPSPKPG